MATDFREPVKTVEEIRESTVFSYSPVIMAIKNKRKYDPKEADQRKFQQFDVEKDSIRAEILTAEQTERAHIKGSIGEHIFNVYLAGAKAVISFYNKFTNQVRANNKVIREYLRIFDRWGLGGNRGNNGLLVSTDPNYVTNESVEIPAVPAAANGDVWNQVQALNNVFTSLLLQVDATTADNDLLVYVYGDKLNTLMASITKEGQAVVGRLMEEKFAGKTVTFIKIPKAVMPTSMADDNGIVVVSNNLSVLEYAQEPTVKSSGENDENEYYWYNYVLGSVQVTPEELGAIIKQPLAFVAAA